MSITVFVSLNVPRDDLNMDNMSSRVVSDLLTFCLQDLTSPKATGSESWF